MPSKVAVCEKFRAELTDIAAASGEMISAPSEVRVHLAECAACRAWFEEERMLFGAIDSGIRAAVNAEAPASLLPRVRAGLNERKAMNPLWVTLGAALSAAVLVLAISALSGGHRNEIEVASVGTQKIANHSGAAEVSPALPTQAAAPAQSRLAIARDTRTKTTSLYSARRSNAPVEILVLVPAGRKAAVDAALLELRRGAVKTGDLLLAKNDRLTTSGVIAPMEIQEMEIKPLDTMGVIAESGTSPTRF